MTTPTVVLEDIQEELDRLAARIERLTEASLQTARRNPLLARRLELRLTIKGVAEASALQILGALSVLPGDMTARQWVAHAGLDPRPTRSGTSVAKPDRLSKAGNAVAAAASPHPPAGPTQADPGAVRPLRTFAPSREAVVPEQNRGSVP